MLASIPGRGFPEVLGGSAAGLGKSSSLLLLVVEVVEVFCLACKPEDNFRKDEEEEEEEELECSAAGRTKAAAAAVSKTPRLLASSTTPPNKRLDLLDLDGMLYSSISLIIISYLCCISEAYIIITVYIIICLSSPL